MAQFYNTGRHVFVFIGTHVKVYVCVCVCVKVYVFKYYLISESQITESIYIYGIARILDHKSFHSFSVCVCVLCMCACVRVCYRTRETERVRLYVCVYGQTTTPHRAGIRVDIKSYKITKILGQTE